MTTFHCLFFFRNGKVRVYRSKGNEITEITRNGLPEFPFCDDSDLWSWWEHITGITKLDDVDFLFVSDTPRRVDHPFQIHDSAATVWGRRKLESFFSRYCDDSVINLQWEKCNKTVSIRIKNAPIPKLPEKGNAITLYVFPALNMPVRQTCDQSRTRSIPGEVFHRDEERRERIMENNRKKTKKK